MAEKAEYRSAKRSKTLIKKTVVELLQTKDLDHISVVEIAEKADINRGTFYAHYHDVYEVVESIEDEIVEHLLSYINESDHIALIRNPAPLLMKIALIMEKDIDYYRKLYSINGIGRFVRKMKKFFADRIMCDTQTLRSINDKSGFLVCVDFCMSGLVGLYTTWFREERGTLTELTARASKYVALCFKEFL